MFTYFFIWKLLAMYVFIQKIHLFILKRCICLFKVRYSFLNKGDFIYSLRIESKMATRGSVVSSSRDCHGMCYLSLDKPYHGSKPTHKIAKSFITDRTQHGHTLALSLLLQGPPWKRCNCTRCKHESEYTLQKAGRDKSACVADQTRHGRSVMNK